MNSILWTIVIFLLHFSVILINLPDSNFHLHAYHNPSLLPLLIRYCFPTPFWDTKNDNCCKNSHRFCHHPCPCCLCIRLSPLQHIIKEPLTPCSWEPLLPDKRTKRDFAAQYSLLLSSELRLSDLHLQKRYLPLSASQPDRFYWDC